jgi:hypothetical protein
VSRGGSLRRGGLHGGNALGAIGDEARIDRRSNSASANGSGTPNSKKRHYVFLDVGNGRCQRGKHLKVWFACNSQVTTPPNMV